MEQMQSNSKQNFMYDSLRRGAIEKLPDLGCKLIDDTDLSATFQNKDSGKYLILVNQVIDLPEVYIGESIELQDMLRIDFILELFISGEIELSKRFKVDGKINSIDYTIAFLETYHAELRSISILQPDYYQWMRLNSDKTRLAASELVRASK